jgi:two-component system CheB/CheR fusion protein
LETSKEEMQSLNEELQTVNGQLQSKLDELAQASDDIQNLLNSTEIATIFLDGKLRIKRFTNEARQIIKLIPGDVGRPLADLVANLDYNELQEDAAEVIRTLAFREREVRTKSGDWRLVRIMPYRTTDNMIDGLVVTFIDINKIKRAEQAAEEAMVVSNGIVATMRESLLVLDSNFRIVSANRAFFRTFQLHADDVDGRDVFRIADSFWNQPELRSAVEHLAATGAHIENFRLSRKLPDGRNQTIILNAQRLQQPDHEPPRLLLLMEDVSPWRNDVESGS